MHKPPKRSSLSFALLVVAGAAGASLVAVFLGLRNIQDGREAAVHLAEVQTRNLAQSIDQNISASLERIDHTLLSVKAEIERNLEKGRLDPARMNPVLEVEQRLLPEAVAIRVTNADGLVILNNPSDDPHANFVDRPFWAYLRDHPEAGRFITKPILGKFTGQWVITSARRYNLPDGRFGGVVVAPVLVEVFEKALQGFDVGPGGLLTLRDSDGGFVARHTAVVKGQKLEVGDKNTSKEFLELLRSGVSRATYHTQTPFDKTKRVFTFRRVSNAPLVVVAGLAEEDYLAQWQRERTRTVQFMLLFVAGVWIVAVMQWRSWKSREQDAEVLRENEARLSAIVKNSRDAIGVSKAGVHVMVNPAYVEMFGFDSPEQLLGIPVLDLIAPANRDMIRGYIRDRLAGNPPPPCYEVLAQRRDGSTFEMEVNASSYELSGVQYTLVLLRDVTERKQAERALLASEHRFRSTLSELSEGCVILGFDWTFLFANAAAALHGQKAMEDLIGRRLQEAFPGVEGTEVFRRYQACMTDRVPQRFEEEYRFPDGTTRIYRFNVLPVPEGIFQLTLDVTEERRKAAEVKALELHLARAQKMDSLGSLAGGVAHDMNNVLGAVLGMASLHLEQAAVGSELARGLEIIVKACQRGATLVKGLLGFARQGLEEEKSIDLNVLLGDTVALLERTTLQKVQLVTDFSANLQLIRGDASALSHAFMNLCLNAVDAMAEGGRLSLRTRNEGPGRVLLEVEDDGCGMPEEVLEKAIDPFFTTKPQGKGTGLGLSIVYNTIHSHGGTLELRSAQGRGTCARILLPVARMEDAAPDLAGPPSVGDSRLRVLLVDDDELIQASTGQLLKALGHTTRITANGEDALLCLEEDAGWEVVILDMNMPGLGGAGTLERIRALRPELPVLLATGRADQQAMDLVGSTKGVTLMAKPFVLKDLRLQLEAIGRRF